jgi:hypothetical protein
MSSEIVSNYIAEVGFFLNGALLSDNSVVLLSDIGEGSGALYCLTNRMQCCEDGEGDADHGIWKFPGDTHVREDTTAGIYFTGGFLNRRNSAIHPTGIYTCFIPDVSRNLLMTLYIGLYNSASRGEPLVYHYVLYMWLVNHGYLGTRFLFPTDNLYTVGSLSSVLSYNRTSYTLTCGGPINTVTWRRNGADISSSTYQLRQSLVDGTTSTYHNLLTVASNNVEDYSGSFSCTVSNSRGNSTQSLDINGLLSLVISRCSIT